VDNLQEIVSAKLNQAMSELAVGWEWDAETSTGLVSAEKNLWSRAARREAAKQATESKAQKNTVQVGSNFCSKIILSGRAQDSSTQVTVQWIKGNDSVLFESFCGMIKRKLET
jgi:23S rRNA (adenine1618-N6)-methyltransferase